jgi:hypothetical protein
VRGVFVGLCGLVGCTSSRTLFEPHVDYAVGQFPVSVAIGDVNGDGVADLVVANWSGDDVSVLIGNGDGTFQPEQRQALGGNPAQVAAADLNSDGFEDVVTADTSVMTTTEGRLVNVLVGATTGLSSATGTTCEPYPFRIAVGDLDGDGHADLVIGHAGQLRYGQPQLTVLMGKGDATFSAGLVTEVSAESTGVVVADVNNDRIPDIVAAVGEQPLVSGVDVILGTGNGSFGPVAHTEVGPTGGLVQGLAVADFDRDGNLDLAAANSCTTTVMLGRGDGSFAPGDELGPLDCGTGALVARDLDGDGTVDLAVTGEYTDRLDIVLGNGDGTFGDVIRIPADQGARDIAVADLIGDGRPDLVVVNRGGTVDIYLHR